jgi:hypothetical protein
VREPVVQPHPATRVSRGREESSLVSHNSRARKGSRWSSRPLPPPRRKGK